MAGTHLGARRYVGTWLGLLALTALTFGLHGLELGAFNLVAALAIAGLKSTLVALYFMHLADQRTVNRLVPAICALFVAVLIALMVADVGARHTAPVGPEPPRAARAGTP